MFNPFMMEAFIILKPVHNLLRKSVDWFLYDRGLHHERVKQGDSSSRQKKFFGKL